VFRLGCYSKAALLQSALTTAGLTVGFETDECERFGLRALQTGKHYKYFREYDPALGRYIESDPIGLAGGINTYTYVEANPLGQTDSYGLQAFGGAFGGGGLLGGAAR
jgi:RHS repeat-associated protein